MGSGQISCTALLKVCFPMVALCEMTLYWMVSPHLVGELLFLNSQNYAELLQKTLKIVKARIFQGM